MKMKLLQWMHQKFQHNSMEPLKNLGIGNPCICLSSQPSEDDQDICMKTTIGFRNGCTFLEPPKKSQEKTFSKLEARRDEETSVIFSEMFHGFLTIGTLGLETSADEPATPTFATASVNLNENKKEVTENALKFVSCELENFLEAETNEKKASLSSARDSHASTITLSGMQMDDSEDEEYVSTVVCPLQGYLLGSSVELPKTQTGTKKERASLQELFERTKLTENPKEISEQIEFKQKHKSAMHFMKKITRNIYASSKRSACCNSYESTNPVSIMKKLGEASDSVKTKKKHHKVLRMFQRRIHPEGSIAIKCKKEMNKNNFSDGGCIKNLMLMGGNNRSPQESKLKEQTQNCKKSIEFPQYRLNGSNLIQNEGQWIKTDADYLVLEL